jgi:hypothetical protein
VAWALQGKQQVLQEEQEVLQVAQSGLRHR